EPRPQRGSRSRRALDPHLQIAGNRLQACRVARGVALETRLAVVHVVARMRDDGAQSERPRALQLLSEAFHAARPQLGAGRREVDEVAVVCNDRLELVPQDLAPEPLDHLDAYRRLAPLIRRFGKKLNRARPQRRATLRSGRDAALAGDVRAQHQDSSVKESPEISGTKRTPPAWRCSNPSPSLGRSRMTSS